MRLETGDNKTCFHPEKPWGKTCDLCRYRRALDLILMLSQQGQGGAERLLKVSEIAATAIYDPTCEEIDGRRIS